MPDRLTEDELAERVGTGPERIRELVELGILEADEGTFARRDVMRARVVAYLETVGIEAEVLARAVASGHLRLGYLESAGRLHPRSADTFADVSDQMGVPFATLERIYVAFGLVRTGRSGEDLLGWLFRRHSEVFMTEHQFEHVEAALEDAGVRRRTPRDVEAAVFADLSGYTRLTEESGDEVAAGISLELAQLVSEVAARHRGNTVKLLGDGVFL